MQTYESRNIPEELKVEYEGKLQVRARLSATPPIPCLDA